jgi:hypothetical protein
MINKLGQFWKIDRRHKAIKAQSRLKTRDIKLKVTAYISDLLLTSSGLVCFMEHGTEHQPSSHRTRRILMFLPLSCSPQSLLPRAVTMIACDGLDDGHRISA